MSSRNEAVEKTVFFLQASGIPMRPTREDRELAARAALPELCVGEDGRYRLEKSIGRGSFGLIYQGWDERATRKSDRAVAVKLEHRDSEHPQLAYEYRVYRSLQVGGSPWIPRVRWYGEEDEYNVLVMDLLGPSLEKLMHTHGKLDINYVMRLAPKMIQRLEYVHSRGLLHRDIKPDNFLVGLDDKETVYLIDYGLAKCWRDPRTREHIPYREQKNLTGTARYASIATHLGVEQSRRDDLEALSYVLVYLARGKLPWQGAAGQTRGERNRRIGEHKRKTSAKHLCRGLPEAFHHFVVYVRSLKFDEEPDYAAARALFVDED